MTLPCKELAALCFCWGVTNNRVRADLGSTTASSSQAQVPGSCRIGTQCPHLAVQATVLHELPLKHKPDCSVYSLLEATQGGGDSQLCIVPSGAKVDMSATFTNTQTRSSYGWSSSKLWWPPLLGGGGMAGWLWNDDESTTDTVVIWEWTQWYKGRRLYYLQKTVGKVQQWFLILLWKQQIHCRYIKNNWRHYILLFDSKNQIKQPPSPDPSSLNSSTILLKFRQQLLKTTHGILGLLIITCSLVSNKEE